MSNQRYIPIPEDNAPLNAMMIFVWFFAWIALVLDVMDWQLVSVSASLILEEFEMSSAAMGLVLGAPLLGAGIGGLVSGILSDKYGRVNVMVICVCVKI
jgi:AAHS family cis,cis-muconate transporter-like MFS transporter